MSSVTHSVGEFFHALGDRRTYAFRNPYLIFGFLWGLPIPIFSVGVDLLASGRPFAIAEILATLAHRPMHFFFLAHPALFAIVFGAMGTIKIIKDARIQEHVRDLALANERLIELDRMKKEFVANITHELKTPLVAILGYTEMMVEGRLGEITERQRSGLETALRSIHRLEHLIDELLEMARIEAGKVSIERRPADLQSIIDAAVKSFEPTVLQKKLAFSVDFESAGVRVDADPERLQRVFANLVSNAIKFTDPGGSIAIRVSRPKGGRIRISVKDTGRGIPERFKPFLFKRFARADSSPVAGRGGTGLGLAIVKAILDAHGSTITVESREGIGTEVTFDLETVAAGD